MDDSDLRIHLLGVFHVGVGPRHVDDAAWRLKRPAALVKLLALAEGRRLHREQVMDRLWPDLDSKAAAANLRKAVHLARRALDPEEGARWLRSEGDLLALPPEAWVDVHAFESAASDARRSRDLKVYRAAIDLYTGDLLPEDRYEEWVGPRQDELRAEFVALSMELAGLLEARADIEGAVEALRRVVDLDPLNEEVHVRLIRAYALAGRRRQALDQFARLRTLLQRELGVEPSAAAQRLHEEIRAGTGLEPRVTSELWERVGDLRLVSGDGEGAAHAFEEAMREHPDRDDASVAARLHRKIATASLVEHRADAVERHLAAAEATLADEAERGRLLSLRAKLFCELGSPAEALDAAEESLRLAERHGDESDIAAANESLAIVHHVRGEWRAGLHAEILRVGSGAEGDARLARVLDLHHCIGQYHLYGDDLFQGVEAFARSTLDLAQTRGARRAEAFAWCLLGESLLLRGHFDEAAGCLGAKRRDPRGVRDTVGSAALAAPGRARGLSRQPRRR